MREMGKRVGAILLLLCVAIQMLPGARAEEMPEETTASTQEPTAVVEQQAAPASVQKVTATASAITWPVGTNKPGDITITTANVFFKDESGSASPYLEVSGLPELTAGSRWCTPNSEGNYDYFVEGETSGVLWQSDWLTASGPKSYTLTLQNGRDEEATIVYAPVTVNTYLANAEELPLEYSKIEQRKETISTSDRNPSLGLILPAGGLEGIPTQELRMVLTSNSNPNTIYAISAGTNQVSVYSSSVDDPRYQGLFAEDRQFYTACTRVGTGSYCGRPLVAGNYDVVLSRGETELYRGKSAVKAVTVPVVRVRANGTVNSFCAENVVGMKTVYGAVELDGGDIRDIGLELWKDGTKMAEALQPPQIVYARGSSVWAGYTIPLSLALSAGSTYTMKAVSKTGKALDGEITGKVYLREAGTPMILQGTFTNPAYANVVLVTQGSDSTMPYKVQLMRDNQKIAEAVTSPTAGGIFDIEFTGANGETLALEPRTNYQVAILTWNTNRQEWNQYSGMQISLDTYFVMEDEPVAEALAVEEKLPLKVHFGVVNADNGNLVAYFGVPKGTDISAFRDNTKFALRVTPVTGGAAVMLGKATTTVETYIDSYYTVTAPIPSEVNQGYLWAELLYDGKQVVDPDTEENILMKDYPSEYGVAPELSVNATQVGARLLSTGISGRNLGSGKNVQIELYRFGNMSGTPDKTISWSNMTADQEITNVKTGGVDFSKQYRGVITCDGVPADTQDMGYWITEENRDLAYGAVYTSAVSVSAVPNGTLKAVPCAGGSASVVPSWTEVYVQGIPNPGYRLKPNSVKVNGKAIDGRAFLALERTCSVTAEFEPIPVRSHNIQVKSDLWGGTVSAPNKGNMGETVVVTVQPKVGYTVGSVYVSYKVGDGNHPVNVTGGENCEYSFTMPDVDVTIDAYFNSLPTYNINFGSTEYGSCQSDSYNAAEGTEVQVTATPDSGYHLGSRTVTDENQNEILTWETDKGFAFFMPGSAVTVNATFERGAALSILNAQGTTVAVKASGLTSSAVLVVGLYNGAGKMVAVNTQQLYRDSVVQVPFGQIYGEYKVKAFLVESFALCKPLIPAVEKEVLLVEGGVTGAAAKSSQ